MKKKTIQKKMLKKKPLKKKIIRPRYSPKIRAEARKLYVEDNMSFIEISKLMQGRPTPQIIAIWAQKGNWKKEREESEQHYYEQISPNVVAQNLYNKIAAILARKNFNTKDADALTKLHKTLQTIINPSYQIPIMYQVLQEYINFLKGNYAKLITDEFLNSIRHFKNELRERLTKGGMNVLSK